MFSRLLALCFLLFVGEVMGESIPIGAGSVRLPEGWVANKGENMVPAEVGAMGQFRNLDGTVWILYHYYPSDVMKELLKIGAGWKVFETGKLSGFDYSVVAEPGKEQSPAIMFSKARTVFQIIVTERGSADLTQMLKSWQPPPEAAFQKAFTRAKEVLFSAYTPSDPDAAKQK